MEAFQFACQRYSGCVSSLVRGFGAGFSGARAKTGVHFNQNFTVSTTALFSKPLMLLMRGKVEKS